MSKKQVDNMGVSGKKIKVVVGLKKSKKVQGLQIMMKVELQQVASFGAGGNIVLRLILIYFKLS